MQNPTMELELVFPLRNRAILEVNFSLPSINEVRWRNSGIVDPLNFCYLATYLSVDGGNIKESTVDLSQFGANSFYMAWKLCA